LPMCLHYTLNFITTMLISQLVPFIVAAVVLMISSGIFDNWDFSPVRSLIIAFFATMIPFIFSTFLSSYLSFFYAIPFSDMILSVICWIILVILISDADWEDKLKITVLGFVVTQVILFFIPFILFLFL
ncbi:MAG: hypothetical protein KAU95_00380, partial [Candidatus Aenigmarchaeota archaeon]|nr:hypothetical protein [Candidatus Aenigmarchaeota archaeon]